MGPHHADRKARRPHNGPPNQSRSVTVSKSLSWLLRHGAQQTPGINMDSNGFVPVDAVLKWDKLRQLNVTFEELCDVVRGNEKQRFALRWVGEGVDDGEQVEGSVGEGEEEEVAALSLNPTTVGETSKQHHEHAPRSASTTSPASSSPPQATGPSETQRALSLASRTTPPYAPASLSSYQIRATQGHSIKTLSPATEYLTPITLASPPPRVCVHGTFRAAWPAILASGGLKPMSRVHVHFAVGPSIAEITGQTSERGGAAPAAAAATGQDALENGEEQQHGEDDIPLVISGMRRTAQVLIYIDMGRALAAGVPFWRSENGVLLSAGIPITRGMTTTTTTTAAAADGADNAANDLAGARTAKNKTDTKQTAGASPKTMVPLELVDVVHEVRAGRSVGVLWRHGDGVVAELSRAAHDTRGDGKPTRKDAKVSSDPAPPPPPSAQPKERRNEKPRLTVERPHDRLSDV